LRVRRRFEFEAAHHLPGHPGKCRELHGHSYRLIVTMERAIDDRSGMVIDFGDLKRIVKREVIDLVEHKCLNDLIDNPTAELVAIWCWERLSDKLPGLVEVELCETDRCSVVYRGA
jgi:6-pyruvoyltetrahydropterin/6-carboxytetrahydropterin synthase